MVFKCGNVPWNKGQKDLISDENRKKIADSNRSRQVSAETKRKISESKVGKKRKPFSEEWRAKLATWSGKHHSEETKSKLSATNKRIFQEETRRKIQSEITKKQWQNPEYRALMSGENNCMKRPEVRAKVSGENSWLWKGGKSFEPYCNKFTETLKEEIRIAFNRKCFLCDLPESENGERLSVHHCDYQKSQGCNGQRWSLIPLCHKCHTKSSKKRWYYFCLLRDYWIYDYIDFFNF